MCKSSFNNNNDNDYEPTSSYTPRSDQVTEYSLVVLRQQIMVIAMQEEISVGTYD